MQKRYIKRIGRTSRGLGGSDQFKQIRMNEYEIATSNGGWSLIGKYGITICQMDKNGQMIKSIDLTMEEAKELQKIIDKAAEAEKEYQKQPENEKFMKDYIQQRSSDPVIER